LVLFEVNENLIIRRVIVLFELFDVNRNSQSPLYYSGRHNNYHVYLYIIISYATIQYIHSPDSSRVTLDGQLLVAFGPTLGQQAGALGRYRDGRSAVEVR